MCKFNLTNVYGFFGGFAETITVVSLAAAIGLAFIGKLTGSFAATLTALGGWGVIHDNMTAYLADKNGGNDVIRDTSSKS